MKKKRTGLKSKHVEITGEGLMEDSTYDLYIQTPLFWLSKSEELLLSASILQAYQDETIKKQIVGNNVFSVVRLLSGFALENIFKSIIAPNIKPTKSGNLPEVLGSHNLKDLSSKAGLKFSADQNAILDFLTEHVMAYGRYHAHKKAKKMRKNSKISSSHDLFKEVVEIWKTARAKLPGYRSP